ncbi:hypothetical protein Ct9H90mP29_17400 [bacterium]|nr:MAG: hypothetical protein Ct9H90mP29_17400 [bacterium]
MMLPFLFGANYYPFVGQIENNFSPLSLLDWWCSQLTAKNWYVSRKMESPDTQILLEDFLVLEIYFKLVGQSSVSVMVGLGVLPMNKKIDGMGDYSGRLIHISFNRRSK